MSSKGDTSSTTGAKTGTINTTLTKRRPGAPATEAATSAARPSAPPVKRAASDTSLSMPTTNASKKAANGISPKASSAGKRNTDAKTVVTVDSPKAPPKIQKTSAGQTASSVSAAARSGAPTNSITSVSPKVAPTSSTQKASATVSASPKVRKAATVATKEGSSTSTQAPAAKPAVGPTISTGKGAATAKSTGGTQTMRPRPTGPPLDEGELIRGIRLQHGYCERPELASLGTTVASLVKLATLSAICQNQSPNNVEDTSRPKDGETSSSDNKADTTTRKPSGAATPGEKGISSEVWGKEWDTAKRNFQVSMEMYKGRIVRHLSTLDQARDDVISLLEDTKRLRTEKSRCNIEVDEAAEKLEQARVKRRNKEAYETLAREVAKQGCRHRLDSEINAELQKVDDLKIEMAKHEVSLEHRKRQVAVLNHFYSVFEQSLRESELKCEKQFR
eukprot:GHVN01059258.1.p2 GENE.GHVN01059258.1~~GHVN01059258.1.p2  ORF type:complete len:448 (-),score=59.54 GHVN01059258.1:1646-2989(-)